MRANIYSLLITLLILLFNVQFSNAQPYCDEVQTTPGFPTDTECEAVVCSIDPFCCNNIWDLTCSAMAGSISECAGCLTSSNNSTVSGTVFLDYNCNGLVDIDDIFIEGIEIVSTQGGILTTSGPDGSFTVSLLPGTEYTISANIPQAASVTEFAIQTPDTSDTFSGYQIAVCPDLDYYDVSGYFFANTENPYYYFVQGDILTFFIHIFNHSFFPVDAELTYTFDSNGLDVTEFDGGQLNGNVVSWQVTDLAPLTSSTFVINLIVTEDAEIGEAYLVTVNAILDSSFPDDVNPGNNEQILTINVGAPPPDPNVFCDQPQTAPGFPGFPECEAVICAYDAWCCSSGWDAYCAEQAALAPECQPCSYGAEASTIDGILFVDYNCNGVVDGDDFALPNHSITSSAGGTVATSDSYGSFSGYLQQSTLHHILPAPLPGFNLPDTVSINTPDTSTVYTGVDFGMCPVVDYQDVGVSVTINGSEVATVPLTGDFTLEVCLHNFGPWDSDGELILEYNQDALIIVESDGGVVSDGEITWNPDISPMETLCFQLEGVVAATAEVDTTLQIPVEFTLNPLLPVDQNLDNNSALVSITISSPPGFNTYCDVPQVSPGFPSDPDCQAVICASDAFCCTNSWDAVCADAAAVAPECINCLYSANTSIVTGKVFVDQNCDGELNNDEVIASNIPVWNNGELLAYTNVIGEYSGAVELNQNNTLTLSDLQGFTVNSHIVFSEETETINGLDFAVCPSGSVVNLAVTVSPVGLPPRPGFPVEYKACVYNYSTELTDAELTFDFSNMLNVQVIDADGGSVVGNEIVWSISDMGVFEVSCFYVTFQVIPGTPPGTLFTPEVSVDVVPNPADDIDLSNNVHSFSHQVVAAYDPNDKTVDKPVVNFTEIEEGEGVQLQYVIRFQNTGNFFATNVRVEDQLPDLLDINTIETLHASHDYELVVHPNNMVEWVFNDIMLPDSTTNEPESHGQIHFRINTVPNIVLEDVIENFASIYFDFKEPIVTEPAITTFLDCSEGSLSILGLEPVCPGEPITLTTNRPEFDVLWSTVSGTSWGAEYYLNAPNEPIEITVTASHPVCTLITTVIIPVSEVPETEINVEDNQLVATSGVSYTWYLDGELIEWATQQWIVPFENGTYTVEVEYENGCMGTAEILYQSVGINSLNQVDILLVPNPARDITQLILPEGNWQVSMIDVTGKLIFSEDQVTVNRYDIALSHLAPGLYFVSVESQENRMVRKLVVE